MFTENEDKLMLTYDLLLEINSTHNPISHHFNRLHGKVKK